MSSKIFFIAGIDTDIGKTYLVEYLCLNLLNSKAIKPIISGFSAADPNSDSAKILNALKQEHNSQNLDKISPWRFELPASPHIAAAKPINFIKLTEFCQKNIKSAQDNDEFLFIESAGGILTPINNDKTFLDLAQTLQIPILLVTSNFLGSISQTLSSIAAIKARNLEIFAAINNNFPNQNKEDSLLDNNNFEQYITNYSNTTTINIDLLLKLLNNNLKVA